MVKDDPGNPIQVQTYLAGVGYPVNKGQLIDAAEQNGAPEEVMTTLHGLPEGDYRQPTDVTRAMSNRTHPDRSD